MPRTAIKRSGGTIRIGISGWRYPPWRGTFYAKGLPQKNELSYASAILGSIEINGTFYSLQPPTSYAACYAQTLADVVFIERSLRALKGTGPLILRVLSP
jgi:uncharacterized protein YecE (DUF72 family)